MKTKIFASIKAVLLPLVFVSTSFAQDEKVKELPPVTIAAAASGTVVNAKINKMFSRYFKDATYLRWYEIDKKFLVKFIMNDQENRALFTNNGQIIYHISYGTESYLPQDVRKQVKSIYYDQKITRVLKVNQNNRNIWVISMEDDKDYIMARVENDEMEETQRFAKSK